MSNDRKMLQEFVTWEKLGLQLITASFHVDVFPHKTEMHFIWWSLLLQLPYANKREYILVLKIVTVLGRERKTWIVGMVLFFSTYDCHFSLSCLWWCTSLKNTWNYQSRNRHVSESWDFFFFFFQFWPIFLCSAKAACLHVLNYAWKLDH